MRHVKAKDNTRIEQAGSVENSIEINKTLSLSDVRFCIVCRKAKSRAKKEQNKAMEITRGKRRLLALSTPGNETVTLLISDCISAFFTWTNIPVV